MATVLALGWAESLLQGDNRAAAQGSNEGELVCQIPMLHQVAPAAGSKQSFGDPRQKRGQFVGHLALHFEHPRAWDGLRSGATVRERGPARCYLGNKGGGISFGRRQRGKAATGQRDLANQRFFGPPAIARVGFTHGPPTGANWARGSLTAPKILQWDRLDGFGGGPPRPLWRREAPHRERR